MRFYYRCIFISVFIQFSSVAQSCLTLCDRMNYSMPGFPVHHHLPESSQTHIHWVSDAIQPSRSLSSHLKLTLTSGPLHMLRTLLRTHFPLARLFQVLTPRVGSLGRPPPPTKLLCSMCSQHQVPQFLNTMYTSPAQRQQGANSVDGMKK